MTPFPICSAHSLDRTCSRITGLPNRGDSVPISLTDDQRALADLVRSWAVRARPVAATRALETDPDAWRTPWAELAALEVVHLAAAESAGGGGGTFTDLAVVLEQ